MQIWLIREKTRDEGLREFHFVGTKEDLLKDLEEHCRNCLGGDDKAKKAQIIEGKNVVNAVATGEDGWEMEFLAENISTLPEFHKCLDFD